MLNILSLGAGVQSTTVLLMSVYGELPKLDAAIFADTQWEPAAVYDHLETLKEVAAGAGIPVHTVSAGDIRANNVASKMRADQYKREGGRWAAMPLRTTAPDGSQGMIKRQCTKEYKIEPIERFIRRELLGLAPRQRAPKEQVVRNWFGISRDEFRRCRAPSVAWKSHVYPLVDMEFVVGHRTERLGLQPMTRAGCLEWLERHGWSDVPRSACIGCPYRSNAEWRALTPDEFADAVDFDHSIRNSDDMRGKMYIHRDCIPLAEVDLRTDYDKGQLSLWQDECDGMCGV